MIVLSRATTGRPAAKASATSGVVFTVEKPNKAFRQNSDLLCFESRPNMVTTSNRLASRRSQRERMRRRVNVNRGLLIDVKAQHSPDQNAYKVTPTDENFCRDALKPNLLY
jgi:hypothetical protein